MYNCYVLECDYNERIGVWVEILFTSKPQAIDHWWLSNGSVSQRLLRPWRYNMIKLIHAFFGIEGHVSTDRNPGPGYNTLLLRLILRYIYSACPHRLFNTLPRLSLDRHFVSILWWSWYESTGTRTHDLPHERSTP